MPDVVLLDTSAAMALVNPAHTHHRAVARRLRGQSLGLPRAVVFELYSALTRAPAPQRLTPVAAKRLIAHNFPAALELPAVATSELLDQVVTAELTGSTVYDATIGLSASAAGKVLITCDPLCAHLYQRLGVPFELVTPAERVAAKAPPGE